MHPPKFIYVHTSVRTHTASVGVSLRCTRAQVSRGVRNGVRVHQLNLYKNTVSSCIPRTREAGSMVGFRIKRGEQDGMGVVEE